MPILHLEHYAYTYPGAADATLEDVTLDIEAGQCHCLIGDTGSGKTTLALAIKHLLPSGTQSGSLSVAPRHDGQPAVGIVLQDPDAQILTPTLGSEVAFGLENLCVDPSLMPNQVRTALETVGLNRALDFRTDHLSMGQKYRLIIAAQQVMKPALLVLDEPSAQLDLVGLDQLKKVILRLKNSGVSFLLCEHHPEWLSEVIDTYWRLEAGRLHAISEADARQPTAPEIAHVAPVYEHAESTVVAENLSVTRDANAPVWSDVSFTLKRGQRVAVCGPNGEGKTTLLRCITGFVKPAHGSIEVFGEAPDPQKLRGRIGYLLQNPPRQLFETTVFNEVAFPLKRLGASSQDIQKRVSDLLEQCHIDHLSDHSPHKLSYGQKHLVALASILAPSPDLVLMDDPFAGLDQHRRRAVLNVLQTRRQNAHLTVVWTTHNPHQIPHGADAQLYVQGGRIVAQ